MGCEATRMRWNRRECIYAFRCGTDKSVPYNTSPPPTAEPLLEENHLISCQLNYTVFMLRLINVVVKKELSFTQFFFYSMFPIIPNDTADIISPARITPRNIYNRLFLKLRFKSTAKSAPVHAPVPGRGIPTKSSNPK